MACLDSSHWCWHVTFCVFSEIICNFKTTRHKNAFYFPKMKQNLDQHTATTLRVTCGLLAVFSMSCALFMCLFKHRTCHFLSLRFWMEIMSLFQGNELSLYGLLMVLIYWPHVVASVWKLWLHSKGIWFALIWLFFLVENGERRKEVCNCHVLHRWRWWLEGTF